MQHSSFGSYSKSRSYDTEPRPRALTSKFMGDSSKGRAQFAGRSGCTEDTNCSKGPLRPWYALFLDLPSLLVFVCCAQVYRLTALIHTTTSTLGGAGQCVQA